MKTKVREIKLDYKKKVVLGSPAFPRQHNNKRKTLKNNLGSDTFDYKTNYCYEYDDLVFMGMTPPEFYEEEQ